MTEVRNNGVELPSGHRVVEQRERRWRMGWSPLALLVWIAFAATCVIVFGGYQLGLRSPTPLEKAAENITPQPTPAAP